MSAFFILLFLSLFMGTQSHAQKAEELVKEPWLGLRVSKPDDLVSVHVPALPPGVGFVVTEVEKDGPAHTSGVREYDLLWKMNDQMLINEGQLATLLSLCKLDEEVTLSIFREGRDLKIKVKIGLANSNKAKLLIENTVTGRDDGILRFVDLEARRAVVSNEMGSAVLSRDSNGDLLKIYDLKGKSLFEGLLTEMVNHPQLFHQWQAHVAAMKRSLDHAQRAPHTALRQPRPRIVPPPAKVNEGSATDHISPTFSK